VSHSDLSIPLFVHAHYALNSEDLPFWLTLAQHTGDPILELGCGTGRVLLWLAQAGYTLVGLDHDRVMLVFSREKLPVRMEERIQLVQADLTAFHFGCRFPLILLPCNTLSTIRGTARESLFACVAEHLFPGGMFAASIPNPLWLAGLPALGEEEVEETLIHPESGNPLQVSSSWERQAGLFRLWWHYDHLLPDGQVERVTMETIHDLAPLDDYQAGLEDAGLALEAVYGDFDRSAYSSKSPNLILAARTPG
jgi:SAM-dependent methyltransferase